MLGVEEMAVYISQRQNTVAQYIAMRLILELFLEAVACPCEWVTSWWWLEKGMRLVEAQAAAEDKGLSGRYTDHNRHRGDNVM